MEEGKEEEEEGEGERVQSKQSGCLAKMKPWV